MNGGRCLSDDEQILTIVTIIMLYDGSFLRLISTFSSLSRLIIYFCFFAGISCEDCLSRYHAFSLSINIQIIRRSESSSTRYSMAEQNKCRNSFSVVDNKTSFSCTILLDKSVD